MFQRGAFAPAVRRELEWHLTLACDRPAPRPPARCGSERDRPTCETRVLRYSTSLLLPDATMFLVRQLARPTPSGDLPAARVTHDSSTTGV